MWFMADNRNTVQEEVLWPSGIPVQLVFTVVGLDNTHSIRLCWWLTSIPGRHKPCWDSLLFQCVNKQLLGSTAGLRLKKGGCVAAVYKDKTESLAWCMLKASISSCSDFMQCAHSEDCGHFNWLHELYTWLPQSPWSLCTDCPKADALDLFATGTEGDEPFLACLSANSFRRCWAIVSMHVCKQFQEVLSPHQLAGTTWKSAARCRIFGKKLASFPLHQWPWAYIGTVMLTMWRRWDWSVAQDPAPCNWLSLNSACWQWSLWAAYNLLMCVLHSVAGLTAFLHLDTWCFGTSNSSGSFVWNSEDKPVQADLEDYYSCVWLPGVELLLKVETVPIWRQFQSGAIAALRVVNRMHDSLQDLPETAHPHCFRQSCLSCACRHPKCWAFLYMTPRQMLRACLQAGQAVFRTSSVYRTNEVSYKMQDPHHQATLISYKSFDLHFDTVMRWSLFWMSCGWSVD